MSSDASGSPPRARPWPGSMPRSGRSPAAADSPRCSARSTRWVRRVSRPRSRSWVRPWAAGGETGEGSAVMTVTQWVRHHAPSTRAGGAGQLVAVAQAYRKPANAPIVQAIQAGVLPVRSAAVVLAEADRLRPLLVYGAEPHVLAGLITMAAQHGPRGCRMVRPALLAETARTVSCSPNRMSRAGSCPVPAGRGRHRDRGVPPGPGCGGQGGARGGARAPFGAETGRGGARPQDLLTSDEARPW